MNVLIIGAGAIGCLVGGKLAQAGHAVTLVGRQSFVAAVAQDGLRLHDERGEHTIKITPAASIMDAFAQAASYDLAILTVKSYDTAAALDELAAAVAAHAPSFPPILSLQNGVGNEEAIAAAIGNTPLIAGSITTPVSVFGPGAIRVDKPSYHLYLSPWQPGISLSILHATQAALQQAGFDGKIYPNAQGMKWTKLLMNIVGNATSAILDMPPDQIFANPALADLEIEAWREALTVMRRASIPPVNMGSYPFRVLAPIIRHLPKALLRPALAARVGSARGGKMPSLHIDLHSGKGRSEIAWLNGAVVRKAEELHLRVPINRMITETLSGLIGNPEAQAAWRHNITRFLMVAREYQEKTL